jgi:hypothetical protein
MVGGMSIEESGHDLPQHFPGPDEENYKNVRGHDWHPGVGSNRAFTIEQQERV